MAKRNSLPATSNQSSSLFSKFYPFSTNSDQTTSSSSAFPSLQTQQNDSFWKRNSNKAPGSVKQVKGQVNNSKKRPENRRNTTGPSSISYIDSMELQKENQSAIESPSSPKSTSLPSFDPPKTETIEEKQKKRFQELLSDTNTEIEKLKKLSWKGIPYEFRPITWKLLLGYIPTNQERRETTLSRKRNEYLDYVSQYFGSRERTETEETTYRQIHIDVPRTSPDITLFRQKRMKKALERVLYIWAIRHPGSGYVQGMNDLVTPFFVAFLSEYSDAIEKEDYDITNLDDDMLNNVEADSYWCTSKLLDGVQDHYTFSQPGIQKMIFKLRELVLRIDAPLVNYLEDQNIVFLQFAFRWVQCFLTREFPIKLVGRMWDTYLADESGTAFSEFHMYVCATLLLKWSAEIKTLDFQEILFLLQKLPTSEWEHKDLEMLLSQAYVWQAMFQDDHSFQ